MPDIEPGKEEEFRRFQRSLAVSGRLDRLIEATEQAAAPEPRSAPAVISLAVQTAGASSGLRAGFAARLARLALALHREAASQAGLRAGIEGWR